MITNPNDGKSLATSVNPTSEATINQHQMNVAHEFNGEFGFSSHHDVEISKDDFLINKDNLNMDISIAPTEH